MGLEGTAWNLSCALVDEEDVIAEKSATYVPAKGGIHPREAAQHHAEHMAEVVKAVLDEARKDDLKIDAVAFSQGPGLGPCLRTVATAARALSLRFGVPLVGVNHCIAHIEVGKWKTGAADPVVLYVSGGNSQVLALRRGRYRIFGETLDISVGNALDKFARQAGLPHPGGPKLEALARSAKEYIPLPYVVKGMDFFFSGLSTAAAQAAKKYDLADVCSSFQETAFAMLVEVSELAFAHAEKKEVLLVGGGRSQLPPPGDAPDHVRGEGGAVLRPREEVHGRQRHHDRPHRPGHAEGRGNHDPRGVEGPAGVSDGRGGNQVEVVRCQRSGGLPIMGARERWPTIFRASCRKRCSSLQASIHPHN